MVGAAGLLGGCDILLGYREVVYTEPDAGTGATTITGSEGGGGSGGGVAACNPGDGKSCYSGPLGTEGVGVCKAGTQTCAPDGLAWSQCEGEVLPGEEKPEVPGDEACDGFKPGEALWSRLWGDDGSQGLAGAPVDAAGNIFLGGDFQGSLAFEEMPLIASNWDMFIAKLSPDGLPLWGKQFGTVNGQRLERMAVDEDGNLIIAGIFQKSLDLGGEPLIAGDEFNWNLFVAKFDGGGKHLWSKGYGGPGARPWGLAIDPAGNILLAGSFTSSFDLGSQLVNAGKKDAFLAKLAGGDGAAQWAVAFGDAQDQIATDVGTDSAGNIIVTGLFEGTIDFGLDLVHDGSPGLNMFLARFDTNGDYVWGWPKAFGGAHYYPRVEISPSGEILLSGWFSYKTNFGGLDLTANGFYADVFVAKLSSSGQHVWSKRYGLVDFHPADIEPGDPWTDLAAATDGTILLSVHASGTVDFGGGKLGYEGAFSEFLTVFNGSGEHVWSQRFGDVSSWGACHVHPSVDASAVLGCTVSASVVDFGTGNLPGAGSADLVVTRFVR